MSKLKDLKNHYGHLRGMALLREIMRIQFKNKSAVLSSFGAESSLLLSMVAKVDRTIPILFLNTGKHFKETLEYKDILLKKLLLKNSIEIIPREEDLREYDQDAELWKRNPDLCCQLRKKNPLQKWLKEKGIEALITGRKRFQTPERKKLASIEQDDQGLFKINPLASFSENEIKNHLDKIDLPQHSLVDKNYFSIGCAPCTRPICEGENPRSGRWPQAKDKTECGIHL
jgi:phosphoadenosine phosphosulfate reductase